MSEKKSLIAGAPFRNVHFGPRDTKKSIRDDGCILLRSPHPLLPYPDKITERLVYWAGRAPQRTLVAQRCEGEWDRISYGAALDAARAIGQGLLARGLSAERPIVILSGNSNEHLLMGLAAQYVGVPYSPIAEAYSLVSTDFGKLRHVMGLLTPGLVFVEHGERFSAAIDAAVPADCEVVVCDAPPAGREVTLFADLLATVPTEAVDRAYGQVGPDTIAKFLFTSGSTGMPKAVINTQRMLCANQQQKLQCFPFLGEGEPPVLLDWLPWNHTFGGNHNVGMMLYNGGSLYIDDGKPVPGGIGKTVANLREIAPTVYFNVPRGFEELVPFLRSEPPLREKFFSRLCMMLYAGAGLTQHVWESLEELAIEAIGQRVPITTGLGCTEASPSALFANWAGGRSGMLGVPVPGLDLKLVPIDEKLEARYRGPNITPGYWRQPQATADAFDEEGYYCTGDAVRFVDPQCPELGLLFDGRIAEDFKLSTGTWVSVGTLRAKVNAAGAPYIQDTVIAGLDRRYIAAILFPNLEACRTLCSELPASADPEEVLGHPAVKQKMQQLLDELAADSTGSATRIERAIVARQPPSIDAGEITDKGSLNQRAVLKNRRSLEEELYKESPAELVIRAAKNK